MRQTRRVRTLVAAVALSLTSVVLGQAAAQLPVERDEFVARRAKLFDKIPDGVAVIFAAKEHPYPVKFRQSPSFYYLTGIEEADLVLVLNGPKREAYVFAPKRDAQKIRSDGPGIWQVEKPEQVYGLTALFDVQEFLPRLAYFARGAKKLYLPITADDSLQKSRGEAEREEYHYLMHPVLRSMPDSREAVAMIRYYIPDLPVQNVNPLVDDMRWVKRPFEIERMRKGSRLGAEGVTEAIRVTKPGMYEYELEAASRYVYTKGGARGDAFTPIVASGPNTVVLHYEQNSRQMAAGDVVYMDYGCDWDYYTCDITRTWPVSGRFTPEQEKMYHCILDAREAIIAAMKPGVTIAALKDVAQEVYKRHGFEKNFVDGGRYTGHYVGMSVHDVGPSDPTRALEAGVTYNVEPLIESADGKLHMRLEDTVLVTATGAENLTAGVTADLEAIYKLVGSKAR